jgi:hypothetical protein
MFKQGVLSMLGNDEITVNVHFEDGSVKQYKIAKRYKNLIGIELGHYQELSGLS